MTLWMAALGGVLGAVGGSFAATAALRSLEGRPSLSGRSACDGCGQQLGYAATVPIVAYLVLRGRCGRCRAEISPVHPIGEGVGFGIGVASFALLPPVTALLALLLGLVLLAAAIIDQRTRRLPDPLTLAAAGFCAMLGYLNGVLVAGLVAAVATVGLLWTVRRLFLASRGDPGLGWGDVKLLAALALWLGVATPWALALAAFVGLGALALRPPADGRLPFGPAIASAGFGVGLLVHQCGLALPFGVFP